ncbi:hypothetical protein [Desulfovibrio gilichinskyi]|uniref:hypothetical protein n=1 Tax=Desulfovibrio gilichinskyi TaxID=1519643 RepID=UPI0014827C5E|nr:hypothetical protein [Desulfovibrio gilichinskyi]
MGLCKSACKSVHYIKWNSKTRRWHKRQIAKLRRQLIRADIEHAPERVRDLTYGWAD